MFPQSLFDMLLSPNIVHNFILAGKIAGSIAVIGGLFYGFIKWLTTVIKKITDINTHVATVVSQSLPDIQRSLDAHGFALGGVKSDVRNVTTQLEETRASVGSISNSMVEHIKTSDQERKDIQINLAKKTIEIAALVAAEKVREEARQTAILLLEREKQSHKKTKAH